MHLRTECISFIGVLNNARHIPVDKKTPPPSPPQFLRAFWALLTIRGGDRHGSNIHAEMSIA